MKNYYVFQQGSLDAEDVCLRFRGAKEDRKLPVDQVDSLHLFSGFTLTSGAVELTAKNEIPIHFYGYYGNYLGSFIPKNAPQSAERLLAQVRTHDNPQRRLSISRKIMEGCISSCNSLLRCMDAQPLELNEIAKAPSIELLRLEEARIRKLYYALLDSGLTDFYMIFSRTRRPPANPANCLLSFWNGLTYAQVTSALWRAGMDPRIGFLHGDARAPNPLALDVAELFKCYFSEHSLVALSHEGPRPRWFAEVGEGVYLNEIGKKEAAHIFDEKLNAQVKHTGLDRHLQFREIMVAEAYKLEKDFLGIEEYKPTVVECTLSSSTICR